MAIYNETLTGHQVGDDYEWDYRVEGDSPSDCVNAMNGRYADEWGSWTPVSSRPTGAPTGPSGAPMGPLIWYMAGKYILVMIWVKAFYTP